METIQTIVTTLNALTPLGLCGGLAFIIYLLVAKKGPLRILASNHLHGLPSMEADLNLLVQSQTRMETTLGEIRDGINFLKGKNA